MEKVPNDKAPSDTISINIRGSKAFADTTTKSLRRVFFQLMAVFSLIMIVVIVVARPDNIAIALSIGIWCFVASCAALYCRKHSASIAKLWALVTCPLHRLLW
jgi:hypothetical protein